jgi:hypothetical protein
MSWVQSILTKHLKLSSIDEEKLLRRRTSLRDSLELTRGVARELESQLGTIKVVEVAGAVVILTALVSDILLDTMGETVGKELPVAKQMFDYVYDKAKEEQWKGNRYEKEIELIKKNAGHLEKVAKLDPTGMWGMVITVHKNMAANAVGLVGHLEDSKESRRMLVRAIKSLQANIQALEEQQKNVEFYLRTGEGAPAPQRFTPAAPRLH